MSTRSQSLPIRNVTHSARVSVGNSPNIQYTTDYRLAMLEMCRYERARRTIICEQERDVRNPNVNEYAIDL